MKIVVDGTRKTIGMCNYNYEILCENEVVINMETIIKLSIYGSLNV